MTNLLSNAARYGRPPITLRAREAADGVVVEVEDKGPGVPDQFVPLLFEKFTRADPAVSRAKGGTGLGLAIVKGLAEANRGKISYEPAESGGAVFALRLPR